MPQAPKWAADAALSSLLEALDEGVVLFDESLACRAVGRRIHELFGVDASALVGQSRAEVLKRLSAASDAPESILALMGDPAGGVESTVADPIELHRPRPRTVVWTSVPVAHGATGVGRIDVLRDVTRERGAELATEQMARRLEEISPVDDLTGLANRRRFDQESDREHRRAQRAWDSYAIARIDIDGMTAFNEARGRAVGDELLRRIGEELRSARREYDVVARFGDDEFIVLLPGADGIAAKTVVKRIVKGLRAKTFDVSAASPPGAPPEETAVSITACAGAAVWIPPSGEGAEDIVRRAGAALAAAKKRGPAAVEIDAGFGEWKEDMTGESEPPH